MKKTLLFLVLSLSLVLCLYSCRQKEETPKPKEVAIDLLKEKAGKFLDTAKDYLQQLQQQKDKFLQDFNGHIHTLNKKIDEQQAEADKATPEMKEKIQTTINKLQEKQGIIRKQLEASKDTAGKAWDDLKSNLEETMKQLDQDLQNEKRCNVLIPYCLF